MGTKVKCLSDAGYFVNAWDFFINILATLCLYFSLSGFRVILVNHDTTIIACNRKDVAGEARIATYFDEIVKLHVLYNYPLTYNFNFLIWIQRRW